MTREEYIKKLIKEKGMSLKSFAEKINLPYTTFHSMLNRGIGKASVDNVIKICKGLDITVEELEYLAKEGVKKNEVNVVAAHFDGEKLTDKELFSLLLNQDIFRCSSL